LSIDKKFTYVCIYAHINNTYFIIFLNYNKIYINNNTRNIYLVNIPMYPSTSFNR